MTTRFDLEHYGALTEGLSREHLEPVRAAWPEARRVFSADGLERYLHAVRAFESIGVTWAAIVTWLREAPRFANEVGEPTLADLQESALTVYGDTS